jgi:Trypsin
LESWLSVRIGSSSQYDGGHVLQVADIEIHPRYNPRTLDCNIALIKAENATSKNVTTQPVKLANYYKHGWNLEQNIPLLAVGWPPDMVI